MWTVARGDCFLDKTFKRGCQPRPRSFCFFVFPSFVHYGARKAKRDLIVKLRAYPLKSYHVVVSVSSVSSPAPSLSFCTPPPPLFLPLSPWQVSHPHCGLWAAVAVQRAEIRAVRRQAHILYEVRAPPAQHSAAMYICVCTSVYVCVWPQAPSRLHANEDRACGCQAQVCVCMCGEKDRPEKLRRVLISWSFW